MEFSKKIVGRFIVCIAILTVASVSAKRFDCRMFCRETGFHGMVGGCRCSFTLFTAKRAIREPVDVTELYKSYLRSLGPTSHRNQPNVASPSANKPSELESSKKTNYESLAPESRKSSNSEKLHEKESHSSYPLSSSTLAFVLKRREQEQDLDNGDTKDFLRLAY